MKALRQVVETFRVLTRARRHRLDLLKALGIRPSGFSDGRFCALPEPSPASA